MHLKEQERGRKWHKEHPHSREQWNKDNPDYKSQWKKTSKGKACAQRYKFKRKAKKHIAVNTLTSKEWLDILIAHEFKCIYCGKHFSKFEMTKEHIIPVSVGGNNTKENVVPACMKCNAKMKDNLELKINTLENRIKS